MLKKGQTPEQKDVFFEVNPLFKAVAEEWHAHQARWFLPFPRAR